MDILRICALNLTHPKSTHTAVHTHTHTHTWSSGQPFMLGHLGSSWGFGALLKGTSVVVLRVDSEHCTFTPPTDNPCWIWDSNPCPLGYKFDSLYIRPRLPQYMATSWTQKNIKISHYKTAQFIAIIVMTTCLSVVLPYSIYPPIKKKKKKPNLKRRNYERNILPLYCNNTLNFNNNNYYL